jgi:hypothetical protein
MWFSSNHPASCIIFDLSVVVMVVLSDNVDEEPSSTVKKIAKFKPWLPEIFR